MLFIPAYLYRMYVKRIAFSGKFNVFRGIMTTPSLAVRPYDYYFIIFACLCFVFIIIFFLNLGSKFFRTFVCHFLSNNLSGKIWLKKPLTLCD